VDGPLPLPDAPAGKSILTGAGLPYTPLPRFTVAAAASAPAAGGDNVAKVKAIITELDAAMMAGQSDKVLTYLTPEEVKVVKPILDIVDATPAARAELEKLITSRFGENYVFNLRSQVAMVSPLFPLFPAMSVERMVFSAAPRDTVEVRAAESLAPEKPVTFILTSGKWQMHIPLLEEPAAVQTLDPNGPRVKPLKAMAETNVQTYKTITQGIQNGTISTANFDSRLADIRQQMMHPATGLTPLPQGPTAPAGQFPAPPAQAQAGAAPRPNLPPASNGGASQLEADINVQSTLHVMGAP
jgi:hypothetical protein